VAVKDGPTTVCTALVDTNGNWSCTPSLPLGEGPHVLTVTATDPAGNTSPANPSRTVTVDNTPPAMPVIASPAIGTRTDPRPTFSGMAEPGGTVMVKDNGVTLCTAVVDASGHWSCTPVNPLANGPHSITAEVTDPAGNASPTSAVKPIVVDSSIPSNLTPVINSPAIGTLPTYGTVPISGTAAPGASVTIQEGGQPLCTATANAQGQWICNVPLGIGPHTLTAVATNTTSGAVTSQPAFVMLGRGVWEPIIVRNDHYPIVRPIP